MAHIQISQVIPAARFDVFDYLSDPRTLPFLLAPAIKVDVLSPEVPLKRGCEFHFMMTRVGLGQSVRLRIEDVLRGSRLTYRQVEGLFASWTHTIKFEESGPEQTLVTDLITYRMPFALLGTLVDDLLVRRDMSAMLASRLQKTKEHFVEESGAET